MKAKDHLTKPISFFRLAIFICSLSCATAVQAAGRQTLHGHVPAAAARLQSTGRLAGSQHLNLALGLPLRNRDALNLLLQELYDPASTNFHRYLTPEQFAERFGPTEKDYQALIAFAKANGLTVTGTHPNRTLLDVKASVADIERVCHVTMHRYPHPTEARTFFAPDVEPSLDLNIPLLAISGLDDFALPHPTDLHAAPLNHRANATPNAGSAPGGNYIGNDFRAAYVPGVSLTGTGQLIGLLEFDGYYPNDIVAYKSLAGLPNVTVTNVLVDGFSGNPGLVNDEAALDIEMAISMAPGLAAVIVYETTNTAAVVNDLLNRMATDNAARQLSSSWTFAINASTPQIFQQYAAQGQSYFNASGDKGAYTGAIPAPADQTNVISVGGTTLTTTGPGGAWVSETVWNWNSTGQGTQAGSGGISTTIPIPSWQQGIDMSANLGSTTKRNIPDVALTANNIWVIYNNGEGAEFGGTSCATPLWAAFTALVNQQAQLNGQPPVGFLNPALYNIGKGANYAAEFHDITTGNNTNANSPNKFYAVAGYDLCTGWGTPAGASLLFDLAMPEPLRITPVTNFPASGPFGGPFNPASQNYVLTNNGVAAFNWSLANTSLWLNVSPPSGTLTPGGASTTVTASLNSAASNLVAGSYTATLFFTNLSDNFVQTRQFILDVVTQPVITSQPVDQAVIAGTPATFSVGTAANALLFYQWQLGGTNLGDGPNIFGSATSALTISNVQAANVGVYSVIVSNAAGTTTSSNALLSITPSLPVITVQPASVTALPGSVATLNAIVVGSPPFFYQWLDGSNNLTDGGNYSGSATGTLTISNVSAANAGTYSVVVSNSLGSRTSAGVVLAVVAVTTPGTVLNSLYSFTGGTDGGTPNGLMQETNGILYGTTQFGGPNHAGTVFQMSVNGTPTNLYSFTGGADGAVPDAELIQGTDGFLYGTASRAGTFGFGNAFKINTNGALTALLQFTGTNGANPSAGLVQGGDGGFRGSTAFAGVNGDGTLFNMTPGGALTTLAQLDGFNNGQRPEATLLLAADGNFYGATEFGGAAGAGVVQKMTPSGAVSILHSFSTADGAHPFSKMAQGSDGNLYGATYEGGPNNAGTVFKMTPAGVFTSLYSFTGGSDGGHPVAGLLLGGDGNFYGATADGGNYYQGTLFRMTPDGTLTTIAQFDGYNGANPEATLMQGADGNIYGTTLNGGANGNGSIFQLSVTSPLQITSQPLGQTAYLGTTVAFNVAVIGAPPLYYHWQAHGTNLVDGGNLSGSSTRTLTLSNITVANAAVYSVTVSNLTGFTNSAGALLQVVVSPPLITVQPTNQTLAPGATATFSVTAVGDLPMSFQWRKNGTNLTDGGNISGSSTSTLSLSNIIEPNNGTYSVIVSNALDTVTSSGAVLTVVPPSLAGTSLTALYSFSGGNDGASPNALTLGADGNLYGTTEFNGPQHHLGTAFRMTTTGVLTTLASFSGTNGSLPLSALTQGGDGNLYGTTQDGGANFAGNIFKMTPGGVLTSLYSFTGGNDGSSPVAALVSATDGNFYGTMTDGGIYGEGNVFKVTPNGAFTNIYSFNGGANGSAPVNPLVQAGDGNFYGTTGGGIHGAGNIFRLSPNGVITNLYSFTGGMDGSNPSGALVQGTDGSLYGATRNSTISGFTFYGAIFKITTNGAFTLVYDLNFNNGTYPYAGLIQGADGNFYGTTYSGGANNDGTMFRISPGGTFTVLTSFNGFDDGAHPETALVQGGDGAFYGTTTTGGPNGRGTIFRLAVTSGPQITTQPAPQSAFAGANVAFSVAVFGAPQLFYQWRLNGTNLTDGVGISGSSARVLNLSNISTASAGTYSVVVTNSSGSVTSVGALLTISSSLPVITQQPTSQTAPPGSTATLSVTAVGNAPLTYQWRKNTVNLTDSGNVSGSTTSSLTITNVFPDNAGSYSVIISNSLGSATSTNAVLSVPAVTPTGIILTSLYSFTGGNDGGNPNGLIQAANGNFYGTTVNGGAYSSGTVFQIPPGGAPANFYSFTDGNDGAFPLGALLQGTDGNLYATASEGGPFGGGTLFSLTSGGAFTMLYPFTGSKDGADPEASLIQGSDGNFYGTTGAGGANGHGGLFKLILNGALTNLHSFTGGSDGSSPASTLVQGPDGTFYGTTTAGGTNGNGAIFKTSTNGVILWSVSLNLTNGANPQAGLARGPDGSYYGTTAGGGANGEGTIFKVTTNGTLTTLYSFSGLINAANADGAAPHAALVLGSDGNFYGAASGGGPYGAGTIFQITPSGAPTTLAWFDGFNGANPEAALLQGTDGDFYGTTSSGGAGGSGVVFRLSVPLPFAFLSIKQTGNTIMLTWSAAAGQIYQLQYRTNLSATAWINLGSAATASNSTVTVSDTIVPGSAQRFYRVVLLP